MRGNEVIYPGPARIVLAAAQLHDPDVIERYSEEWLASLRHRPHLQQWRDAVSLLLRGARATRWAHQGTDYSQPRVVVASQVTMALAVAVGMALPLTTTMASWEPAPGWRALDMPTLYMSLTAAGTIGLVLLTRRSWWARLGWLAIGVCIAILANSCVPGRDVVGYSAGSAKSFIAVWMIPNPDHATWIGVWAMSWWMGVVGWLALYAALTLFVRREPSPAMRALAAVDIVLSAYFIAPDWVYEYAYRLGLADLIRPMSRLLIVGEITVFSVAPGIGFLLGALIIVAVWRCVVIGKSLLLPPRRGPSGAWACLR